MNFGTEVQKVVSNHVTNMEGLDAQEKELQEQVRQEKITSKVALEKRKALEDQRAAAIAAAQREINRLHQEHDAAVDKWSMPDGSKLTDDAKLLAADFPMNQAQFQMFCDKYRDNSVMLTLLAQYADRHPDSELFADRPADEKARKAAFADYCERAIGTCRTHNTLSAALFLSGNSVPKSVYYEY